jgi:hypothetical protein
VQEKKGGKEGRSEKKCRSYFQAVLWIWLPMYHFFSFGSTFSERFRWSFISRSVVKYTEALAQCFRRWLTLELFLKTTALCPLHRIEFAAFAQKLSHFSCLEKLLHFSVSQIPHQQNGDNTVSTSQVFLRIEWDNGWRELNIYPGFRALASTY